MTVFFFILLGIAIGSFLNVCIDRIPKGETILMGRSHCDFCKKPLRWFELIPLLSFVIQQGKCRRCHRRLSWQYPLIEGMTGLGFGFLAMQLPLGVGLGLGFIIFSAFVVIFVTDVKEQIIPDSMLIVLLFVAMFRISFHLVPVGGAIASALVSGAFFWLLWRITSGRGMGFGDVKLAPVLGLLLGHPYALIAFYIAFLTGAFVGVILMIGKKAKLKTKIAFGPFLIVGSMISFVWGMTIWQWWQHFL